MRVPLLCLVIGLGPLACASEDAMEQEREQTQEIVENLLLAQS